MWISSLHIREYCTKKRSLELMHTMTKLGIKRTDMMKSVPHLHGLTGKQTTALHSLIHLDLDDAIIKVSENIRVAKYTPYRSIEVLDYLLDIKQKQKELEL